MNCDCIVGINKALKEKGEELTTMFTVGKEKTKTYCMVKVRKIFGKGKASNLIPNFCPFCGTRVDK